MIIKKSYSFDDVMLVPKYSTLNSRRDADLSTSIAGVQLNLPIIAANMSSICEDSMARAIGKQGGLGVVHRMCTVTEQAKLVSASEAPFGQSWPVGFSIGIGPDWQERMEACKNYADIVCLDIAHAHHERVLQLLSTYFAEYQDYPIIIGQIATANAVECLRQVVPAQYYRSIAFKVGIGGGSLCTTRVKTGCGMPTLQSIFNIRKEFPLVDLIADGGIKTSGDVVKALAAGANAVMVGGLIAGTDETPGNVIKNRDGSLCKIYRGSASFADKNLRDEETQNIEGEETLVPFKGAVRKVINSLSDGIRSGMSYQGSKTIKELQDDPEFIEVSAAGYRESLPHGKFVE